MGTRTRLLGDPHFSSASIGFRGHLTVGARETWIIAWTNMSQFCSDWAMRAFNSSDSGPGEEGRKIVGGEILVVLIGQQSPSSAIVRV